MGGLSTPLILLRKSFRGFSSIITGSGWTDEKKEIKTFESSPYHQPAVQLRLYDDDGEVADIDIKPVDNYRDKLESLLL